MDRRVFIIRTWLLLIALCGVTLAWPSVGIGVWPLLGMMISTYKCCCGTCCSDNFAGNMQVVLAGFANGHCTNCAGLNGTYEAVLVSSASGCTWFIDPEFILTCTAFPPLPPPYSVDVLGVGSTAGNRPAQIVLNSLQPGVGLITLWQGGSGGDGSCEGLTSHSVPFFQHNGAGSGTYCTGTPTALLTAL